MTTNCRLFMYDRRDKKMATKEFNSIYSAVKTGYEKLTGFNTHFIVVEEFDSFIGGNLKLYWSGGKIDKDRNDFHKWSELAQNKDIEFSN